MSYSAYGITIGQTLRQMQGDAPMQQPDSYLDYTYQAGYETSGGFDPIVSVALSVMPSGTGEVVASRLTVAGDSVTVWMNGGVAGRTYTVKIDLTMASGREQEVLLALPINPALATYPIPPAPSPGFGTPITWTADGVLTQAGGYLTLSVLGSWPTSNAGLIPGALYAAAPVAPAFIFAVVGFGYVPSPPVFLVETTGAALLAMNASIFPQIDPHVVGQIWINGEILCVSLG